MSKTQAELVAATAALIAAENGVDRYRGVRMDDVGERWQAAHRAAVAVWAEAREAQQAAAARAEEAEQAAAIGLKA